MEVAKEATTETTLAEELEQSFLAQDSGEETEVQSEQSEDKAVFTAPDGWDDERVQWFDGLDDVTRERMLGYRTQRNESRDRVGDFDTLKSETDLYRAAVEPLSQRLNLNGMDAPTAVRQLVAAQQALDGQPLEAMSMLARQYGAGDPARMVRAIAGALNVNLDDLPFQEPEPQVDQNIVHLQQGQAALAQQINVSAEAQARAQIDAFKTEKNSEGADMHPHFDKVSSRMGVFMNSDPSMSFEAAYGMSVRSDPDLYKENLEAEVLERMKGAEVTRKESVKDARAASRNVTGSRQANTRQEDQTAGVVSIRDSLESAYDQLEPGRP